MQKKMDYARTVYDKAKVPITSYPEKLIDYLINKYKLNEEKNLLELGPARGDFLKKFSKKGFKIFAVDISDYVKEYCPNVEFKQADLDKNNIPYEIIFLWATLNLLLSIFIFQKKFLKKFLGPKPWQNNNFDTSLEIYAKSIL